MLGHCCMSNNLSIDMYKLLANIISKYPMKIKTAKMTDATVGTERDAL